MKKILEKIAQDKGNELSHLIALFNQIRPSIFQKKDSATQQMEQLIGILRSHADLKQGLRDYLIRLTEKRNPMRMLADLGITPATGFFQELIKKINHKYLPPIPQTENLGYIIEKVFYKRKDYIWVAHIPDNTWTEFFALLDLPSISELVNLLVLNGLKSCKIGK